MEATTAVAPPPQRVCPNCARISYATGPRCPYCTRRFSKARGISPWMLVVAVIAVLAGMAALLVIASAIVEDKIDDRVEKINRDFDASLNRFRNDVRKELDARLPAGGAVPSATASPTTTSEATPTETPREEIRP
jgi:hypothetical protein